ncbi:glycosyltransferase [Sphingobium aquiterrae]|uniref:glycosyltransferase n=1 Tax=Sphingobium aquiterrae TaxID=2038656 RepID=UPI00301A7349
MKKILCVHQGTEKYGSDKSFVAAVAAIERLEENQTSILLPGQGEIFSLIQDAGLAKPEVRHLWVLRKADFLRAITLGLPRNLFAVWRAMRDLRGHDLVYVNTAVIVDFLLASILTRRRLVVHVREIPVGAAMKVIRALLIAARATVIFNSQATKVAFDLPAGKQHQSVVYNGFEPPAPFVKDVYDGQRPLRLLCIGRLNAWKGQEVLARACALLPEHLRDRVRVRIVGGVYKDQTHFREALIKEIADNRLTGMIEMSDFIDDPGKEYIASDLVIVPSTLPEPFGRVAIEGMAYRNAIIATNHGGLTEIVEDGVTGRLIAPNDPQALCDTIAAYADAPASLAHDACAGEERFLSVFTQDACDAALIAALEPRGAQEATSS